MRRFRFYKDELNRWYVDLPEWEGDQAELEMVCGADTMLDILAQGDGEVRLTLSLEPINDPKLVLHFNREEAGGAWYDLKSDLFEFEVWLCHVTRWIYGELPKTIYCI
jgi:hypothetical protein